jgi:hypothetical protein
MQIFTVVVIIGAVLRLRIIPEISKEPWVFIPKNDSRRCVFQKKLRSFSAQKTLVSSTNTTPDVTVFSMGATQSTIGPRQWYVAK